MSVYAKISSVTAALAQAGIGKEQRNEFDKYDFRGIDDCYNVLGPLLAVHKLVIIPQVQSHEVVQIKTSQGKPANHATVVVNYLLTDAEHTDNVDSITATFVGEASDRGDKAINKAMSAAYKLLVFQLFCVPTEGQGHDSEEDTIEHDVPTLGDAELATVREMLDESMTEEAQYCAYLNVQSLEQIPLASFSQVCGQLKRKIDSLHQQDRPEQAPSGDYGSESHGE